MKVYLAGKIPKGDEIGRIPDWRAEFAKRLSGGRQAITVLSPEAEGLDENDPKEIFGHDCYLISEADLIVVNADGKLGVGTAQEMIVAKYYNKTVATILPENTHHRRSNLEIGGQTIADWKHPFVMEPSDYVFSSLDELIDSFAKIERLVNVGSCKKIDFIDQAISHYLEKRAR